MTIVLDIETIPGPEADANLEAMEAMGRKREQDGRTFANLCPALARVVAVGFMVIETGYRKAFLDGSLVEAPQAYSED